MSRRSQFLRLLERLTSFVPGPPSMRPDASVETRRARHRLWSHKYRKRGKGSVR